jgi:hypothetical protein
MDPKTKQMLPIQHDVIKALGPKISLPSPWDLYFDPKIVDAQEQTMIVHEMRVPHSWVMDNTGPRGQINPKTGLQYRFCPQAVAMAGTGFTAEGSKTEEDAVRAKGGISAGPSTALSNPFAPLMDLLWECWQPKSPKFGYTVILNRIGKPINHPVDDPVGAASAPGTYSVPAGQDPTVPPAPTKSWPYPYEHHEMPFFWGSTQPDSFSPLGMSEYERTIDLLREADQLRSMRIDTLMLLIMGVWQREGGFFAGSGQLSPVPGESFPVAEFGKMTNLFGHLKPDLVTAMGEQEYINNEHDACLGTGGNVRGSEAQVGRVTGAEQTARLERADERILMRLGNLEAGLARMPRQILMLMYQFARQQPLAQRMLANVTGLPTFPWFKVANAMNQDYQLAFTLGRKDKALVAQQASAWMGKDGMLGVQMGLIQPPGVMEVLKQTAAASGLTNIGKIITGLPPMPAGPGPGGPPQPGPGGPPPEGGGPA